MMKRLIPTLLLAFLVGTLQAQTPAPTLLPVPVMMRSNQDGYLLNFPEGEGASLMMVSKGQKVTILGKSGNYYYCEVKKKQGYLPQVYFDPPRNGQEGPLQKGMSPDQTRQKLGAPDKISRQSSEGKSAEVQYFEKKGLLLRFEDEKLMSWSHL
jgi:hypothetical protein